MIEGVIKGLIEGNNTWMRLGACCLQQVIFFIIFACTRSFRRVSLFFSD